MNTNALILLSAVLLLFLATSTSVSAYGSYGYMSYPSFGYRSMYYGTPYTYSGATTGSIIGPLWYRYSTVSPYHFDRYLDHLERNPISAYSYANTNNLYRFVGGTRAF